MAPELRNSGISVVGDMPWGTHLCHFYETREDLLEVLLPYFKAGLENNEFCMWVVSDPLREEEARMAFKQVIPEADRYLSAGHIEIVPYTRFPPNHPGTPSTGNIEIISHSDWYLKGGAFIAERVLDGWNQKLTEALAKGYAGLRANGNESWLTEENRKDFIQYEETLDESLAGQKMIVLCSYPLSGSSAAEIFDVVNTHQLGILRRKGNWEVIETPEPIHAQAEIRRLNKELRRKLDKGSEPLAILRYGLAVLSVIAALIVLLLMDARLQAAAHVSLFLCAVIVATWFGGIRPGLLAIVLSTMAFAFILPPSNSLAVEITHLPRLILFALLAFFVASLVNAQRNKAMSLGRARDVLNGTVQQIKRTNEALRGEIIERREAEEALRQSEERFVAFMDNLPGYAWMKDLQGRYVYVNEMVRGLPGYRSLGKTDAQIWPADLAAEYQANDEQVIATKRPLQTLEHFQQEGKQRYMAGSKFPIFDKTGAVALVGGAGVDITERIEAEEALRRSEDRIRMIIDTIPVMAWSVRPDGVVDFLNQRWLDYAGLSLEQYVQDPTGPIHPDDIPRVMEKWRAQMAIGEGYEDEMRLRRADGKYRWFLIRTEPLRDEQGNLVKWYGSSTDIEDRKEAEEKLKETSQQLRALSASVQSAREEESKRIAREIHDELGGALTSWKWDLEEIRDQMSMTLDASQVATVHNKIEGMIKLTETTLDIVRRLASELRPAALELGLVQGLEWQALQFENRTGIAVQLKCAAEDVDLDNGQATAVFRILQEALTNIQRHAQATQVTINCREESGQFILTIKDNGRGITESEKSDRQSLGLLGMRERAHLVGGEIKIESTQGKGTEVTVRVPLSTGQHFGSVAQTDS
jgi:PAS domain S-box-containing protein